MNNSERELDDKLKRKLLGEDGGLNGVGIIVDREEIPVNHSTGEDSKSAKETLDLVAVLWSYGEIQWYPWARYDHQRSTADITYHTTVEVLKFSQQQKHASDPLFVARASLKCFERHIHPSFVRTDGVNIRNYFTERGERVFDKLEGKAALVNAQDRLLWHSHVAKASSVCELAHLLNLLVYTIGSGVFNLQWLAFRRQWHVACSSLANEESSPKRQQQKLKGKDLRQCPPSEVFSALPRLVQFSSLLSEVVSRIDPRGMCKSWKRGLWKFPVAFDYSLTPTVADSLKSKRKLMLSLLEHFGKSVGFLWSIPKLDEFTQDLKKSIEDLEIYIPPRNFKVSRN